MKILKINSQSRRDFYADYECEGCGFVKKNSSGYDDDHYHDNVIPNMKCTECGKSRRDMLKDLAEQGNNIAIANLNNGATSPSVPAGVIL